MKEPHPEEQASFNCTLSNGVILDLDTFHILTADIQDAVYFRIKEGSCVIMGNCFDFTFVKKKCRFDQLRRNRWSRKKQFCIFREKAM